MHVGTGTHSPVCVWVWVWVRVRHILCRLALEKTVWSPEQDLPWISSGLAA